MQPKKIPVRRCVGCNEGKPKKELVRVVRSASGEVSMDLTGKLPGRGAYLCRSAECLAKARKAKRLERAFELAIPAEVYERLEQELGGALNG
ncbi:MAG: YlxR family protein [Oscillospiraceae bacterium]|nr:YlxR family protein [Oscillospiraceae bacterium]